MTYRRHEQVACECGHEGTVHISENDQPYSKPWERFSIEGFDGAGFEVEGFCADEEMWKRLNPKCPECGQRGKVSYKNV